MKKHRPDCDAIPEAAERAYSHCTCPDDADDIALWQRYREIQDSPSPSRLPWMLGSLEWADWIALAGVVVIGMLVVTGVIGLAVWMMGGGT